MLSLTDVKSLAPHPQLKELNARINRTIRYEEEQVDTWRTPKETLERGQGDCEDYCIVKFFALKALGWPEDRLRIVYTRQTTGRITTAHMVLQAFDGQAWWVLDNLCPTINLWSERTDLKVVFGFTTSDFWIEDKPSPVDPQQRMKQWRKVLQRMKKQRSPFVV